MSSGGRLEACEAADAERVVAPGLEAVASWSGPTVGARASDSADLKLHWIGDDKHLQSDRSVKKVVTRVFKKKNIFLKAAFST